MAENEVKERIFVILKKHPEGLTISQIAKEVGMHRHSIVKYVYELTGEKKIIQRKIGPATLCYIYKKKFEKRFASLLPIFFISMFILPSVVHAVNFTLYLGTTPLTTPFPTGGRLAVETAPTTRREISPGEFDASGVMGSVCSVDTDAGQWRPNETISNTSAARQIGSACHVTNDAGKLDAGWLWNSTDLTGYNLSNSTERNGNWSFQITTRSGQTNGVEDERILARVSVVRNEGGTLTLIKDLLETRVTGAGTTLNLGQQGWRDADFRVTHAVTGSDTLYNIEIGPTNESYIFRKGDALYFELGFGDGGDATDRTL